MPKLEISTHPELKGLTIITNQDELKAFVEKLRQDWYPPDKPEILELAEELNLWLKARKPNTRTFFAVYDEEDDHAKNDGWGSFQLFRCIAIRMGDGKIYVFKILITNYPH